MWRTNGSTSGGHSWAVVFILTVRYVLLLIYRQNPVSAKWSQRKFPETREGGRGNLNKSRAIWHGMISLGFRERDIPSNLANLQFDCSTEEEFKTGGGRGEGVREGLRGGGLDHPKKRGGDSRSPTINRLLWNIFFFSSFFFDVLYQAFESLNFSSCCRVYAIHGYTDNDFIRFLNKEIKN